MNTPARGIVHRLRIAAAPLSAVLVDALPAALLVGLFVASFADGAAGQHPVPVTDCANCHLDPQSGSYNLPRIHDYNCASCHPAYDFTRTILGPIGTWNHECSGCHNPSVFQTGNLPVPTKGHRCVVCHGTQMSTADPDAFHQAHAGRANCVVCHGFVPDLGTVIGSGNRAICLRCHDASVLGTDMRTFHREMTAHGLDCLECHGGARPPVDVRPGPPVGNAATVCDLCHAGADPRTFASRGPELHRRHAGQLLDCGACHADAELQDDRQPMPPPDDPRRAMVSRGGFDACTHCHDAGMAAAARMVHRRHIGGHAQWCYDCHAGADPRPVGQAPPVTRPAESCRLCHGPERQFASDFPFAVHAEHAERVKCNACHQGTPPLFEWPERWQRRSTAFTTYGAPCAGSNGMPQLGNSGLPRLGRSFQVTLASAPPATAALIVVGVESTNLDLGEIGMTGCALLVQPATTIFAVTGNAGTAAATQSVPDVRELVGVAFYYQWFAIDLAANQTGMIATAGGRGVAGR